MPYEPGQVFYGVADRWEKVPRMMTLEVEKQTKCFVYFDVIERGRWDDAKIRVDIREDGTVRFDRYSGIAGIASTREEAVEIFCAARSAEIEGLREKIAKAGEKMRAARKLLEE